MSVSELLLDAGSPLRPLPDFLEKERLLGFGSTYDNYYMIILIEFPKYTTLEI